MGQSAKKLEIVWTYNKDCVRDFVIQLESKQGQLKKFLVRVFA